MAKNSRNYQRLLFIEASLIARGSVDRKELDMAFNAPGTAGRVSLKQYKLMCPENITEVGNASAMERQRSEVFKPIFFDEDMGKLPAKEYLNACHVMGDRVRRAKERVDPSEIPPTFNIHRHVPRKR